MVFLTRGLDMPKLGMGSLIHGLCTIHLGLLTCFQCFCQNLKQNSVRSKLAFPTVLDQVGPQNGAQTSESHREVGGQNTSKRRVFDRKYLKHTRKHEVLSASTPKSSQNTSKSYGFSVLDGQKHVKTQGFKHFEAPRHEGVSQVHTKTRGFEPWSLENM